MFHKLYLEPFFISEEINPPPFTQKRKSVVFFQILKPCLDHHQPTNKLFFLDCFFMFKAILEEHQPLSFIILNFYGAFLTMSLSSYYILNIYPFYFEGGGRGNKDTMIIIVGVVVLALVPYY